jgi:CRP-like cAMP-binding protein
VRHWRVLQPARLAVLDAEFAGLIRPYPEILSALFARAMNRSRHLAVAAAIIHQPRIDFRLQMMFWELADRWGTGQPDGFHVPVSLTHATLGELVAARRPSVTKALGELARGSALMWTGRDWVLPGPPPAELLEDLPKRSETPVRY